MHSVEMHLLLCTCWTVVLSDLSQSIRVTKNGLVCLLGLGVVGDVGDCEALLGLAAKELCFYEPRDHHDASVPLAASVQGPTVSSICGRLEVS